MTTETKNKIEDLTPWINRVLLGLVAFFLVQTNRKFERVIDKLDQVISAQAVIQSQVLTLSSDINENKQDIGVLQKTNSDMGLNITSFYKEYGYLFSERARKKLE